MGLLVGFLELRNQYWEIILLQPSGCVLYASDRACSHVCVCV